MRRYILTVTLNPAIDETVTVGNFGIGKEFVADEVILSAGGKGINVSRVLKKLKIRNIATGFIAGSAGDFIKDELNEEGIKNNFVKIEGHTRTSLTIIDPKSKLTTRVLQKGPAIKPHHTRSLKTKIKSLLKNCSFIVLSGRNLPGVKDSIYYDLIAMAKRQKVRVILDAHGKSLRLGLKAKPYYIKPNRQEAEDVLGIKLNSKSNIKKAIQGFLNKGITTALISLGAKGAVGSDGDGIWMARPPKVKCLNHVGCGDAFNAGFILSIQKRKDFRNSLKMAVAVGTANAMSMKPGLINEGLIQRVFKQVKLVQI